MKKQYRKKGSEAYQVFISGGDAELDDCPICQQLKLDLELGNLVEVSLEYDREIN